MHLAVDARLLESGGIGTYLREVMGPWLREPEQHAPGLERLTLLGRPPELDPWVRAQSGRVAVEVVRWEDRPYSPRTHLRWPLSLAPRVRAADHLFFPHWDVPLAGVEPPFTLTVHDLTQFLLPHRFPGWKRRVGKVVLRRAAGRAGRILTVSERSAADLAASGLAPRDRIRVIPNGVSTAFSPEGPCGHPGVPMGEPYLLLVGWDRPHKNAELAVRILGALCSEHRDRGTSGATAPRLVLVGNGGRMEAPTEALATALGVRDRLICLGRVSHDALPPLYRGAVALLLPSLHEGFGLPALEAMACGTPALLSDQGSLPEVAGPASVIGVHDLDAWVAEAGDLLRHWKRGTGPAAPEARALRRAHAATFDWEATSRRVFRALRGG